MKLHLLNLVLVSPFMIPPPVQETLKDRDSLKASVGPRMTVIMGRDIENSRKLSLLSWLLEAGQRQIQIPPIIANYIKRKLIPAEKYCTFSGTGACPVRVPRLFEAITAYNSYPLNKGNLDRSKPKLSRLIARPVCECQPRQGGIGTQGKPQKISEWKNGHRLCGPRGQELTVFSFKL